MRRESKARVILGGFLCAIGLSLSVEVASGEAPLVGTEVVISGLAVRTVSPAEGQDGIGTLCLGIVPSCPNLFNQNPRPIAGTGIRVFGVDLSRERNAARFRIAVPRDALRVGWGYSVAGYLAEDGRACASPTPQKDDLVTFEAFGKAPCGNFEYQGRSVSGLVVRMSFVMPK